jgi:hypothetical protein
MPDGAGAAAAAPGLAQLQAWLQARVTAGVWDLPEDPAGGPLAAEVVAGSGPLAPRARLEIYAKSYVLRLAECLRAEFPVLAAMIGPEVFNLFAGAYLGARPSRSPTLYDLGAGFADYLAATRPPDEGAGALTALPADLARLERAIAEAGRAQGLEGEPPAPPLDAAALLFQPGVRLRTPATLRLLALRFDFSAALAAQRAGERPAPPLPSPTLVAVARRRYAVRAHRLEPWAFAWLGAVAAGADLQAATAAAAEASGRPTRELLATLLFWLPTAADAGFVAA